MKWKKLKKPTRNSDTQELKNGEGKKVQRRIPTPEKNTENLNTKNAQHTIPTNKQKKAQRAQDRPAQKSDATYN